MRKTLSLLVAVLMSLTVTSALAKTYLFTAGLNQGQVVPAPAPANVNIFGGGVGTFAFDDATNIFFWSINYANLSGPVLAAHIHGAPSGINGGIVIDLVIPDPAVLGSASDPLMVALAPPPITADGSNPFFGQYIGEATLLPAAFPALTTAPIGSEIPWYVNLHTALNPGGEIRGQLFLQAVVPLPATAWLLFSALGAIGLLGRRST